ncbi:MAG: glycosyltransferase [Spirochaetia bacterium]|nr:glycosyltransferase [Spirochaetia bacterium]
MKILVMSSQASNTGSALRAYYLAKYLKKFEPSTEYLAPPFVSMPLMADFILSFFFYFFALLNKKYDVVIIVKPYPNTVLPAMLLKSGGARLVIDIDDLDHGYRDGAFSSFIARLQHRLVKTADLLTTHNRELMKLIIRENPEYKNRVYYLKQCVDAEFFTGSRAAQAKKIRKEHEGFKILFYMAHLNIAAYLDEILCAVGKIEEQDVRLIVAGGGPMEAYYRKKVKKLGMANMVVFTGQVTQEKAAAYACAADLCLVYYADLPVNKYRASMKLREYLGLGRAVVATEVGEIGDFKGFIRTCRPTPEAFADAIEKALAKNGKNKDAKPFIHREYNWKTEAARFLNYLKGIV